ncbi:MAG: glycine betaine ABC transporter substrate-binding protein, partial [Dehalococcoidia bacterium]
MTGCSGDSEPTDEPLRAGSFNFDEGRVLSWIFALAFEDGGIEVDTSNLEPGSTREILAPALEEGTIDFVPEYIGSLLDFVGGEAVPDPDVTFAEARSRMLERGVTLLPSAPAQNNNAFVVTRALSE